MFTMGWNLTCRNDTGDERKCEGCGGWLVVLEEGLACLECGVVEPCSMRVHMIGLKRAETALEPFWDGKPYKVTSNEPRGG
jgi:hypothetical protein